MPEPALAALLDNGVSMTSARVRGLICDLDGTLIDSHLDFGLMRRELGVPDGLGILEHLDTLRDPMLQNRAQTLLHQFESAGGAAAKLFPGVGEFLELLRKNNIPLAVLTRNSQLTARQTMERLGIVADILVAREDARPKPHPDGVLKILRHWNISPEETMFVGDFLYDIEAGKAAGVPTVLYANAEIPHFAHAADFIVRNFYDLETLIFPRS